jgi:hypothetical protein
MVSFGVGIDLAADLSAYGERLSALVEPGPAGAERVQLHDHGVIFRGVPWDATLDLGRQIERIVSEGEFVDMRHLKDSTRIRRAKLGVAYISGIDVDA